MLNKSGTVQNIIVNDDVTVEELLHSSEEQ